MHIKNTGKNEALKIERGISFEGMVLAIEADGLLDELSHPNPEKYPNQSIFVIALDGYVYLVPCVEEAGYYFLKTVIRSRKAIRNYLCRSNPDEKLDAFEQEILAAYEKGELKSTSPSKDKLVKFKAASSAAFLKEKRVNIRISTPDYRHSGSSV